MEEGRRGESEAKITPLVLSQSEAGRPSELVTRLGNNRPGRDETAGARPSAALPSFKLPLTLRSFWPTKPIWETSFILQGING